MRHLRRQLPSTTRLLALLPILYAFFYGPLAFGATTPDTAWYLGWLALHGFLGWLVVLLAERRWPRLPRSGMILLGLLGILAVFQVANPVSVLNPTFGDFNPIEEAMTGLPGSYDAATSARVLWIVTACALGGIALADLLVDSKTRWLLLRVVALSGFTVAVIGIYQKASGADAMLWTTPERSGTNFFCAYRYHANSAAFLNLCWPAAFAVWLRSRLERFGSIGASLDLCVFLITLGAVFVNTSKAGQVIGFVGALWVLWRFRADIFVNATTRAGIVVVALFVITLTAVLVLPGLLATLSRWNEFTTQGDSLRGRYLTYGACLHAITEAPVFGTGAGTFQYVFPFHTNHLEDQIAGYWEYAHQDYLQTLIEWGFVGGLLWALLAFGALLRLGSRARAARRNGITEITSSVALIALAIVLIHALIDFPFQIASIQWVVTFYLAIAWSESGSLKPKPAAGPPEPRG